MKTIYDLIYDDKNNKLDIYIPENHNFKTIVYFHGGGLKAGDKRNNSYLDFGKTFTDNGYAFVSCNYRMYPNAKFPDYLYDASCAIKYIKDHINKYGGNNEIIVSGQSAGAWMALMLCLNKEYLSSVNINPLEIKAWIIDSAQPTSHFNVMVEEKGLDYRIQRIDEYAPIYYLSSETKFSKILLMFYKNDMICRNEQNRLFYSVVKMFNSDADIEFVEMNGGHCEGSSYKDETGEYPYIIKTLEYLKRKL